MLAACKLNGFFPRHPVCRTLAVGWVSAIRPLAIVAVFAAMAWSSPVSVVHVWEEKELTFTSTRRWANPYTDGTVWVDIVGPGFRKRVFGFWDGDRAFCVRLLAPMAGEWKWRSGSSLTDPGLSGLHGEFRAIDWSEEEKQQNPLRRGFLRATANHHAIEQADGSPFFIIGDTWYAAATNRFR